MIVRRIEIIKGAAFSAWGSALGGVINIITKEPGTTSRPTGTVSAPYGGHASQDYAVDAKGRAGNWWGATDSPAYSNRHYNTFIWELSGRKSLPLKDGCTLEFFGVVHNLFNGSQYSDSWAPNAPRWLAAALIKM